MSINILELKQKLEQNNELTETERQALDLCNYLVSRAADATDVSLLIEDLTALNVMGQLTPDLKKVQNKMREQLATKLTAKHNLKGS